MRACWAVTLLVLVQPSPASYATCRGTSVVPRVLAPTHRHLRKSPSVRRPFAEISGSISFSSLWFPFPETVSNFVCHFKGSLHWGGDQGLQNHQFVGSNPTRASNFFESYPILRALPTPRYNKG